MFLMLFAACGSKKAPTAPTSGAPPAWLEGTAVPGTPKRWICDERCIEAHRSTCKTDAVWRIRLAPAAGGWDLVASATGLLRVSLQTRTLFTIDSRVAVACIAGCGGEPGACVPYPFGISVSTGKGTDACAREATSDGVWQGLPSRRIVLSCGESRTTVVVVPELVGARDALIRAGAMPADDLSIALGGLAVAAEVNGRLLEFVSNVEAARCAELELPEGWPVKSDPGDVERADAAWKVAVDSVTKDVEAGRTSAPGSMATMFSIVEPAFCHAFSRVE